MCSEVVSQETRWLVFQPGLKFAMCHNHPLWVSFFMDEINMWCPVLNAKIMQDIVLVTLRNCIIYLIQQWPFSSTATIDVKKTILDLCTDVTDCFVAVVKVCFCYCYLFFLLISIKASIRGNCLISIGNHTTLCLIWK